MNKKTKALSTEQYKEIIQTLREGCCYLKANERIAMTLIVEAKGANRLLVIKRIPIFLK